MTHIVVIYYNPVIGMHVVKAKDKDMVEIFYATYEDKDLDLAITDYKKLHGDRK
jgi:hypothetical protein